MEHFDLSSVSTENPSTWQKVKDGASDAYHQLAFKVTGNPEHLKALSRNKEAGLNLPQTNMFQENEARGGELADIALAAQPTTGDKVKNAVVPRFVSAAQENAQLGTFKAERTAAGELPAGSEERAVVNHIKGTTKASGALSAASTVAKPLVHAGVGAVTGPAAPLVNKIADKAIDGAADKLLDKHSARSGVTTDQTKEVMAGPLGEGLARSQHTGAAAADLAANVTRVSPHEGAKLAEQSAKGKGADAIQSMAAPAAYAKAHAGDHQE
ncbi:MAG TPA: hypothetical protein VKE22_12055 [Haliangiales bacterium]|nr:hypothetical protein [Haliangiales bacterium]